MLENLPVLLLKKLVLLPYQEVRLELNNSLSKKVVDLALNNFNGRVLVICPYNNLEINPTASDLPCVGVIAKIKTKIELPNENYRVSISGFTRVQVKNYGNIEEDQELLLAVVKRLYIDNSDESKDAAIIKSLKGILKKYMDVNPQASNSVSNTISNIDDLDMLTDVVTNFMPFDIKKKISYMNEFDYVARANNLIKDLGVELQVLSIESKIDEEIRESFDKEQKDYIIKQKISKLNEELGINVDKQTEVGIYNNKIDELIIDEKIKNKLYNEVKKYSYTSETNPDSSVIRNYLDTVINLPWNIKSIDETDVNKIRTSLDESHYGLDDIKRRVIEYIAIKNNNKNINAPIICLVGPPGTGKTTLGMSIGNALNREFYKISVGGLNDPSELTGHKRTYLGSSPGKIIQGIKKCGTNNPVILIDEVDKIVNDFKGDPSAVLLDILDQNQNSIFIDNYIEEPFDLSDVMFILTANDIKNIPSALKDRLEIIELNSYTEFEKLDIVKKYIIPEIIKEYGTKKVRISDDTILKVISSYTKESGVRELTRVFKKIYRSIILSDKNIKTITKPYIEKVLGPVKYENSSNRLIHCGSTHTLGVTPYGGVVINIESLLVNGTGKLFITGNVEESLQESANIALNHIFGYSKKYGVELKKLKNNDIHINALNYSIKKSGTSGGLAFTTAILSLLLDKEVPSNIAFTGEITLHGDVCRVAGIKEKLIGAYNNNFKKVYIPQENSNDLATVPKEVTDNLEIICVSKYEDVYKDLF